MVRFGLADADRPAGGTPGTPRNAITRGGGGGGTGDREDESMTDDRAFRMPGAFVSSPVAHRTRHQRGESLRMQVQTRDSPVARRHDAQQDRQQQQQRGTPQQQQQQQQQQSKGTPQRTPAKSQATPQTDKPAPEHADEASMRDDTMDDSVQQNGATGAQEHAGQTDSQMDGSDVMRDSQPDDAHDMLDDGFDEAGELDALDDDEDDEEQYELAEDWPSQLADTALRYKLLAKSRSARGCSSGAAQYDLADLQDDLFGRRKRDRRPTMPSDAERAKFACSWAIGDRLVTAQDEAVRVGALHTSKRVQGNLLRSLRDDLVKSTTQTTAASLGGSHAWKLASALFDPLPGSNGAGDVHVRNARRQRVSTWLHGRVAESVRADEKRALDASERVFAKLTGNQVVEACTLALSTGDLRLATLLAQAGGDDAFRESLAEQIEDWRQRATLPLVKTSYRMIYELLAGNTVVSVGTGKREDDMAGQDLPLCRGLDWQRAFGLKLWYGSSLAAGLDDAFDLYDEAVSSGTAASPMLGKVLDMEYLLLRFACTSERGLAQLLDPSSLGNAWSDYGQTWMIATFLAARHGSLVADDLQALDRISTSFATQLAQDAQWREALTVASCLSSSVARESLIKRTLARCVAAFGLSDDLRSTLAELDVPAQWALEAEALHHRSRGEHELSCAALLRAGLFNEAHRTIRRHIGPHAVISGKIEPLDALLAQFDDDSTGSGGAQAKVVGWESCGQVYKDVVRLIQASRSARPQLDMALVNRILAQLDNVEAVEFEQRVAKSELVALVSNCLPVQASATATAGMGGRHGKDLGASSATLAAHVRDLDLAASKARQLSVI